MNKIENKDVLVGLSEIEDDSIDLVIIDPPYNIKKDFGVTKDDMSLKEYKLWSSQWISECERILKDSGTLYIYGFSEILCHLAVDLPYPLEHYWLIWNYHNKSVPRKNFWQRSHEAILCCWKYEKKRIFNTDDVRVPYTDTFLKNAAGKVRKGTKGRFSNAGKETVYNANENGALPRDVINVDCPVVKEEYLVCKRLADGKIEVIASLPEEDALKLAIEPRDVIKVSALAGGAGAAERWFLCKTCKDVFHNRYLGEHASHETLHHPTQKPYNLTRYLLAAAKPKDGGKVVIPFVGSGSECAVAEDLGLEYVGFELNQDYVDLANGFLKKRNK